MEHVELSENSVRAIAKAVKNGSGDFTKWLGLFIFLTAQILAGVWWAATISSEQRAMTRAMESTRDDVKVLQLKIEKAQLELALAKERYDRKGG